MEIRTLNISFTDKDFKKLSNAKEESVIIGESKNWEEFILIRCNLMKSRLRNKGVKKK